MKRLVLVLLSVLTIALAALVSFLAAARRRVRDHAKVHAHLASISPKGTVR